MTIGPRRRFTLKMRSGSLVLGDRTLVMGILNVTPDSFSDAGKFYSRHSAVEHAMEMIVGGADILDIGGESTRPQSDPVPLDLELERVLPIIETIRQSSDIPISIDTMKAEVAKQAIQAGADIINDVSALRFDPQMAATAASAGVPLIVMHMQGTPKTMQDNPTYTSLLSEVVAFLEERIQYAVAQGVPREQIIVDPGIGFGKTADHNLRLIRNLETLQVLERPILLAASRKRFIGAVLSHRPVEDREIGTAVVNAFGIAAGAQIIRVHDVNIGRQVAAMSDAIRMGTIPE